MPWLMPISLLSPNGIWILMTQMLNGVSWLQKSCYFSKLRICFFFTEAVPSWIFILKISVFVNNWEAILDKITIFDVPLHTQSMVLRRRSFLKNGSCVVLVRTAITFANQAFLKLIWLYVVGIWAKFQKI